MGFGYMRHEEALVLKETFETNRARGRARRVIKLRDQGPVTVRFAEGEELETLREGAARNPGKNLDRRRMYTFRQKQAMVEEK